MVMAEFLLIPGMVHKSVIAFSCILTMRVIQESVLLIKFCMYERWSRTMPIRSFCSSVMEYPSMDSITASAFSSMSAVKAIHSVLDQRLRRMSGNP